MAVAVVLLGLSAVYADANLDLIRGVRLKNIDLVKTALNNGADPNQKIKTIYGEEYPLLQEVCLGTIENKNFSYEAAKLMIEARADINAYSSDRYPILFAASRNKDTLRLMIARKADLTVRNKDNDSVLMEVMNAGESSDREERARMLIDAKADVNALNNDNDTALIYACHFARDSKAATMLINAGAAKTINTRNKYGWTALMWAIRNVCDNDLTARMKKEGAVLNEQDKRKLDESNMGG